MLCAIVCFAVLAVFTRDCWTLVSGIPSIPDGVYMCSTSERDGGRSKVRHCPIGVDGLVRTDERLAGGMIWSTWYADGPLPFRQHLVLSDGGSIILEALGCPTDSPEELVAFEKGPDCIRRAK